MVWLSLPRGTFNVCLRIRVPDQDHMLASLNRFLSILPLVLSVLWTTEVTAQVTADFTAPVTSGCSPLIVNFQNQSTGTGLTYQWNLGNGNSSSALNPSASYINPGTYTVTLTVTGPGGTDTEVKTAFITVFTPPEPQIAASQNIGCFPVAIQFTDQSIPGDSPVTSWSWDFGDGGVSTAQNPTHTYTSSGSFNVTLLLTDANGCTSNRSFPSFISTNSNAPVAGFSSNIQTACIPPVNIAFTGNAFGGTGPLSYSWAFGDGGTSTLTSPFYSYAAEGVYDVTLTVTDQLGCQATSNLQDYITIVQNPSIDFSVPNAVGCLGDQMQFTDLSSPPPTSWVWDFGDGNTSTQQNPTHLYTTPGTYSVTLTASYAGSCEATEVKAGYISIGGIPFVSFSPDQNAGCEVPFPVNFTNNSVGTALSYSWDFGDGSTSTDASPSHTYLTNGAFVASLTATNQQGCSTTQTTSINALVTTADFLPDVFGFCTPVTVNFSDLSVSGPPITDYQWDFGDGSTSTLANPIHTYADTGRFSVSLIITNSLGCTDTLIRPNYIFSYTRPVADFDRTPQVICPGDFQFTNFSAGATDYFWDFGDNGTDVVENPIHNYQDTGFFSVTLVAINNGCTDTIVGEDMIFVTPPIARYDIDFSCSAPNTFTFTNNSIGDDSFSWSFGDGTVNSTDNTVTHTYAGPGMYFVDLTVTNIASGCTDGSRDTVYVTQLNAAFTQNVTEGCAPLSVSFTDQSADAVSWQWNFGGGASSSTNRNPNRTFNNIGTYTVRLIATDINGCRDTLTMPGLITTFGAEVAFAVQSATGCDELTVTFADQTAPPGSIVSWLWDFGDGGTSTAQNPTHVYSGVDTFDVTLTTTNNIGCINTRTIPDAVVGVQRPVPDFVVPKVLGCIGELFVFINNSSTDAVSFQWDFGDGNTSTEPEPTHSYAAEGTYTVSLTAINAQGCDSTMTRVDVIQIDHPDADFTAFPTFAFCPPLLVSFTDQSSPDAVAWQWQFGNGSTSTIQNPSHIYSQSGVFTVTLVVTNANGCNDTIVWPDLVTLAGPQGDFIFFPDTAGCPPYEITYQSNATNASQYTWDFGDGSLGSGPSAVHTYMQSGAFTPTLILRDDNGCTFTFQSTDTLIVTPLIIDAGSDVTICSNGSAQLNAIGGNTYSWFPPIGLSDSFSGSPVANPSVTTEYVVTGLLDQCQGSDTVTVFVNPIPVAAFSSNDVCLGNQSVFSDASVIAPQDSIVSWSWELGQTLSTDTNPTTVFNTVGTFDISLVVVGSNGCVDTAATSVTVLPSASAGFVANDTCLFQPTIFNDLSSAQGGAITQWQWSLGNGATSAEQNPTVVYSLDSVYTITLVVTAEGGCTDTIVRTVGVHPLPQVDFVAESVCFGNQVNFIDSTAVNSGSITQWQWTFGDGNESSTQNPEHLYATAQNYLVSLTAVTDLGCTGSASGQVSVWPLPVSAFTMSATQSCYVPVVVDFQSISQGASSLQWDLGNGSAQSGSTASTIYTGVGQFNVQLTATTQFGCSDSVTQVFEVFPTVVADFSWSDPVGCQPWEVTFTNATANGTAYQWSFENAGGTTTAQPIWVFEDAGDYSVTLVASGAGGCGDTITFNDIITVFANPVADFEYQSVTEPQPEGIVVFTNTSTPSWVSNTWDFGDGGTSTNNPATNQYDFFGNELVTLSIRDANGCVDTISRYVSVDFFGTLFVPNALSANDPNPDVTVFLPKGKGLLRYRCMIFDKWGNKLWESTALIDGQPAEGWDGRYRGEPVPQGAYVWKIDGLFGNSQVWEGQDRDGTFYQAGTVTVIR
jgi:PKD repeat protein